MSADELKVALDARCRRLRRVGLFCAGVAILNALDGCARVVWHRTWLEVAGWVLCAVILGCAVFVLAEAPRLEKARQAFWEAKTAELRGGHA